MSERKFITKKEWSDFKKYLKMAGKHEKSYWCDKFDNIRVTLSRAWAFGDAVVNIEVYNSESEKYAEDYGHKHAWHKSSMEYEYIYSRIMDLVEEVDI